MILPEEPPSLRRSARALLRVLLKPMTNQTKDMAFWGRVSTEDNQDPESSRVNVERDGVSLAAGRALISRAGGIPVLYDVSGQVCLTTRGFRNATRTTNTRAAAEHDGSCHCRDGGDRASGSGFDHRP
ncbi:MAG: hypothetical protein ACRDRJ_03295 [Streptosporangiaceae bacterium]